ncbi:MAG: hypothetical protein ACODAD_04370 [Planctomycetota bacterium]
MIRWSYVLPRLAVAVTLLAIAHYGIPPVLRWTVAQSLESVVGGEVSVGEAWTSLVRGELRMSDVRLARAGSSKTNKLEIGSVRFVMDLNAAAYRRCIIEQASISGLRFDTPRQPALSNLDGEPESSEPEVKAEVEHAGEHVEKWLRQLEVLLAGRIEDEFESLQLARQLAERWPADYRRLQQQTQEVLQTAKQLHGELTNLGSRSSPLDRIDTLGQRWRDVQVLRRQIQDLQERATTISHQVQRDRESVDRALDEDHDNLREKLELARLRSEQLNHFLLHGEALGWWRRISAWLEFVSWMAESRELNEVGSRGRVVQYRSMPGEPRFLIRAARLEGQVLVAGRRVDFSGQARNLTLPNARNAAGFAPPVELKLVTRGPFSAHVHASVDSTEAATRYQLALRCDDLPLPARGWGDDEHLSVSVGPSRGKMQARFTAADGQLEGRLRLTQHAIPLSVTIPPERLGSASLEPLRTAAAEVDQVDFRVDLEGTLDEPRWHFHSDLGSQLQQQFQVAAERFAREQVARTAAEAESRLDAELAGLQRQLAARQTAIKRQLQGASELLSGIPEPVASRLRSMPFTLRSR